MLQAGLHVCIYANLPANSMQSNPIQSMHHYQCLVLCIATSLQIDWFWAPVAPCSTQLNNIIYHSLRQQAIKSITSNKQKQYDKGSAAFTEW